VKPLHTLLATVAGLALAAYAFADPKTHVVTSGTVALEPRVPYRLTFETPDILVDEPLSTISLDRQREVRGELARLSAYDIRFERAEAGPSGARSRVSFNVSPLMPLALTIGQPMSAPASPEQPGIYGPALLLRSVERLDGKAFE
jgi:hypothetical protein